MSQSPTTSAATPDVTQDAEPTVVKNGMSHAPVLITPQEVMFGTGAVHRPPASALPAAQQLPRAVMHGPRNGPIMSALQTVVTVVLLALFAVGVHDLQLWLERWDHARHFND
jgi:hypothetical protein